jgi:signal peptidase I
VTEASMRPAIEPGDWLLVDPTTKAWPRRGTVVVFREPDSGELAIKRIAGCPGDHVPSVDSRRYGPVPIELLVGRAWFRYAPLRRIGRLGRLGSRADG